MSEVTAEMIERGRGPDPAAAAKRRRLASQVRQTREKLTSSGTGHRAFDLELYKVFAKARRRAAAQFVLLAGLVGTMATLWVPPAHAALWFAAVTLAAAVDWGLCTYFRSLPQSRKNVQEWLGRFVFGEALQGCAWASLVLLMIDANAPAARTFVLISLLLVGATSAMIAATIPLAVYGAILPLIVATIGYMQPLHDNTTICLTVLAAGSQALFIALANRLYATSLASLSFRFEKETLIVELEQAKANSDEARRRAEEANLAKSRFLATMSHELRTPLNAILGFSEVMKGELFGAHTVPAYRDYSNDIHSSGTHLLMLINEILDLSRVEAGRYELREESVSLAYVVDDCRHLLAMRAKKRDIELIDNLERTLPRIWADERAVRQVTLNLLTNAIKFTPQGGSVTIKVGWTRSGGQYLSIRDTGPGIPENEIPVVMSSFGRGTLAQKNAEEGSGLGLPIVKGLIELHGGVFTIRSKVREGTEVIVVFPPERVMDALPQLHFDLPGRPGKPGRSAKPAKPGRRHDAA
ncbi:MAG TPA: HAMP domain-containing sensor histidine kinase [Beijerinckiaceae bacterium]|nr:HAMP domain-containing sensor histidine kinase [Beijerinckiaceae bacterium]